MATTMRTRIYWKLGPPLLALSFVVSVVLVPVIWPL